MLGRQLFTLPASIPYARGPPYFPRLVVDYLDTNPAQADGDLSSESSHHFTACLSSGKRMPLHSHSEINVAFHSRVSVDI